MIIAVSIALAGVGIVGLSYASIDWYPAIKTNLDVPISIIGYIGFGILSILPIIINTKEAIRWRYLISES